MARRDDTSGLGGPGGPGGRGSTGGIGGPGGTGGVRWTVIAAGVVAGLVWLALVLLWL